MERNGDDVVIITLNRPATRNAINVELAQAIVEAVTSAQSAKCIVLTGTDPGFCSGLDLRSLGIDKLADLPPFVKTISNSEIPVIAAVNGSAVTGGFEIALACDFIVASEHATFADTHLRVGVYPGPVLVELPRRIGMARAREMSMTGNFVDAQTALRIGLANHVVKHANLLPFTLSLASSIAEQNRHMISTMRHDWNETGALPIQQAHERHSRISLNAGFGLVTDESLQRNMSSVIARAHQQAIDADQASTVRNRPTT